MEIDNIKILGITCDSRKVKEGYIFVALSGENFDGNNFIMDAVKRGAVMVYTEKAINNINIPIKKVNNARKALAELCNAFYDYPTEKLKIIGVTGTNGKTTTTCLIYNILRSYGLSVGLIGTLSVKINDKQYASSLTTPDAENMYQYLDTMVKEGVRFVIMEVSSHGLKTERVHGIKFDIAIHTNIERDHLNFHKTMEDYINSKKKLFNNLRSGKFALINLDDFHGLKLLEGNDHFVVITYGLGAKATITASSIDIDFPISFNYCLQRGITTIAQTEIEPFEYPFIINLIGKHNIYNALAAITTCILLDIPIEFISNSIKQFKSIPRRTEIIYNKEVTIIDDFSHNPASYDTVFQSIQSIPYRNVHIVNALRGGRGAEINKENAQTLAQWAEIININTITITSSIDCISAGDQVSEDEKRVFKEVLKNAKINFTYKEILSEAIEYALFQLEKGDILLLLGAQGMEKGREICLRNIKTKMLPLMINKSPYDYAILSRH